MSLSRPQDRVHLEDIFRAALKAVDAPSSMTRNLRADGDSLIFGGMSIARTEIATIRIAGAGKGSAFMAKSAEEFLLQEIGDRYSEGLVVVKDGHVTRLNRVECLEASHPVPDSRGEQAAGKLLDFVRREGMGEVILFLLSGGASALIPAPADGISLEDKISLTETLLECGADIHEINVLRKHCSRIKGGRLAGENGEARWITLAISDVPGDLPVTIGSGPTVGDPSTLEECWKIVEKYDLKGQIPDSILRHLSRPDAETPKPEDPIFAHTHYFIVANNAQAVRAAVDRSNELGFRNDSGHPFVTGDVKDAASRWSLIARKSSSSGSKPFTVILGGEPTVRVRGRGKGGRNMELALRVVMELEGKFTFLSAGTDGTDGPTDAAGAFVDETTLSRARNAGLDPDDFLERNDSYSFFKELGDLFITGPTGTNVMDLQMLLIRG